MTSLLALIPIALVLVLLAGTFLAWAIRSGQYDDLDAPAIDVLRDDTTPPRLPQDPKAP